MKDGSQEHRPHQSAQEPNLFDFVPKNVWREVYNGHWNELTKVQKAEFALEVVVATVFFIGVMWLLPALKDGNFAGALTTFSACAVVLLLFFVALTRSIR